MAVSATLATVQAELLCPICLSPFNDPVTIACGHNFCASCIRMSWSNLQYMFHCPVCEYPHMEGLFTDNPQLGRLVDLSQCLHSFRSSKMVQGEDHMCKEHNQVLSLFCEDDQKLVCPQCIQLPPHQGRNVKPVGEAAFHQRQRLSSYKESLKKRLAQVQKLAVTQQRKILEMKEYMAKQRGQLVFEFEQLYQIVEKKQEATFSRLNLEHRDLQNKLRANFSAISDYFNTLKALFIEATERIVMSEGSMLREVENIRNRCENLKFPSVWTVQFKKEGWSLPPLYSELEKIIQRFQEEVTLDPLTAHPSLCLSEDRKSVIYMKKKSKVDGKSKQYPNDLVVLGSEGYRSGRHYWEVQVGNKPEWAVGVCTDAPSSKGQLPLSGKNKHWMIQLQNGDYLARGSVTVHALKGRPTEIGIFLDYELGQISFYNARDRSHIYSFLETFSDVLKPYFLVGQDSTPLIVSTVRDLSTE
ncbi:tripartite motif-containing protein 75-like [Sorex fumeus]|uniref:tripartite motif-containing protein 75-like n=1 Tax=Sorex fumeus TaxID=62283 RepID=UPI0024AC9730|nr:tripartite motif-containing protein 75-like [Sorex fumeus]